VSKEGNGPQDSKNSPYYALARYMGIGLEVAIAIVLCVYAGAGLDRKFGLSPLFLVTGIVVGFAVVINILLYYSRAANKDAESNKNQ
jgi:F0F1-type ATP synthase assembly protein I